MKWEIKSQNSNLKTQNSNGRVEQIIKQLLDNRGISESNEIEEFLNPQLPAPDKLISKVKLDSKQLSKAVACIHQVIANNEPIVVHGDYDVDGICGTAILWEAIYYGLGYKNVTPFIPHRITHGYGMSKESIDEISKQLVNNQQSALIITTDCGISAVEAIEHANSLGFDVIVTDHHAKSEKLPDAAAILHTYDLSGTGIAYLLAQAITNYHPPAGGPITNYLELTALATIADLQPLLSTNRILTKFGLEELNQTQRVGLRELMKIAGLAGKKIGPYEVGWMLSPRLNAMGRLQNALDSLRLLCTKNPIQAEKLAEKLNKVNQERQRMTEKAYEQARKSAQQLISQTATQFFVLHHEEWHEGIIGLVAAKITEEFYRPTIAIAKGEKISKGSARSINGVNIIETIRKYSHLLLDAGGHEMAAGFSIETNKIEEFTEKLSATSAQLFGQKHLEPILKIDLELSLSDITLTLYQELKKLEPHGVGNPRPTFLTRNVEILGLRTVGGNGKHLKLQVRDSNNEVIKQCNNFSCIGFGLGERGGNFSVGDHIDIVYQIQEDTFNGYSTLQLKLKDLRLASSIN